MRKILPIVFCLTIVLSSCSDFSVPDDWKGENGAFLEKVKEFGVKIDPQQNWVANVSYRSNSINVTPAAETKTFGSRPVVNEVVTGIDGLVTHPADFFRIIWGPKTGRELEVRIEVQGSNVSEYGLYYYNMSDQRIEKSVTATGTCKIDFTGVSDSDCFGVYMVQNGQKIYSESRLNAGLEQCCEYIAQAEEKDKTSNRAYIYLRDATFKINSNDDIVGLDYDRGPWMLICEDVGNANTDNDFNDVVFVVHRTDATHIFVEYCATGASINDEVCYNDQALGEIHSLLNVPFPEMLNVFEDSAPHTFSSTMEVPADFTMTNGDFGGFFVSCLGVPNYVGEIGDRGYAPFMIVVPSYMKWCKEYISIFDAYPEFIGWVQDHNTNVDWFMHPVESKVVSKAQ